MKHTIQWTAAVLALLTTPACLVPMPSAPWDMHRVSRAKSLGLNETQIRAGLNGEDGELVDGGPFVDVQYGVLPELSLGLSTGKSQRRLSEESETVGEEVIGVMANMELPVRMDDFFLSTRLDTLFKDGGFGTTDSSVEFRPSFAIANESMIARGGVSLQDRLDPQVLVEAAYWAPIGEYMLGTVELTGDFGDLDELYVAPGAATQLRELVQLQLSFPIGLNSTSSRWQSLVSLVIRF